VRAFGVLVAVGIALAVVAVRLVYIQGVAAQSYLGVGASEWEHTVTLSAARGAILDRNGDEMAVSVPQTTIYADPREVTDPDGEAAALAPVLGVSQSTLRKELSMATTFVYLARTVPDAVASKVTGLHLAGVYGLQEAKRFYPDGQLGSPLIGTVGIDGTGLSGLEYQYNKLLAGKPGKLVEQIDPQGDRIPGGVQDDQASVAGDDLVLTVDEPLQYDAEQALAQAIVAAKARSGIALLMDSTTGDILADAQLTMPTGPTKKPPAVPVSILSPVANPAGGPAAAPAQPVEASSATAFTQVYEPGSVNKLITISAALQQQVIAPSDVFAIPDTYNVSDGTFHDAESHGLEHWTVTDILANSSNIGTIEIAQKLGRTGLLNSIHNFGLGSMTDIDFPGESAGLLPSYWSGTSIATVPIGQGISVTAMQMLAAYNAIANGGVYIAPRLVNATIDSKGRQHVLPAPPSHRVVSTTVARQMTTMLDEVVRVGTGTAANLSPYTVAGKTGTALVPNPAGGYETGQYVASFAGFVPAEKPAITAMVVIDGTPDYGAAASAPTFATIARDALQELEVPPQPAQPPAPGVPLATPQSATGAGEVAGSPLPGLNPGDVAAAQPSTTVGQGSVAPPTTPTTSSMAPPASSGATTVPVPSSGTPAATTTPPTTAPPATAAPTSPAPATSTTVRPAPSSTTTRSSSSTSITVGAAALTTAASTGLGGGATGAVGAQAPFARASPTAPTTP
jgi:cell division protein FtsI (penicillin-binding protein 3)